MSARTAGACHSLQATIPNDEEDDRHGFTHPLVLGQWVVDHQVLVAFGFAWVGDVLQKQQRARNRRLVMTAVLL